MPTKSKRPDADGMGVRSTRKAAQLVASPRGGSMLRLRSQLGLSREVFARLIPTSTRTLATIESGGKLGDDVSRRLIELDRMIESLSRVMAMSAIGGWLTTPNQAFQGAKPLEIVERGEIDRLWQMIFLLQSGSAS